MASRSGTDPIARPFRNEEEAVEVARIANYARGEHQGARRMRKIANFGSRILPNDMNFMHVVQKLDITRLVTSSKNARL
jgi:hypothetical protein